MPLKTVLTATTSGGIGACDLVGPLPITSRGSRFIFSFVDCFTKWIELVPLPDIKATTVARCFVDNVITRHGCYPYLICDNGSQFTSSTWRHVCEILQVKIMFTEIYRPNQNPVVRCHGSLKSFLSHYVNSKGNDWDDHLQLCALGLRTVTHAATKEIPFFATYGRDCLSPWEEFLKEPSIHYDLDTNYSRELVTRLQLTYKEICENQRLAFANSKAQYDKRTHPVTIAPGDVVYIRNTVTKKGHSSKFAEKFLGPYRVIEKVGSATSSERNLWTQNTIRAFG